MNARELERRETHVGKPNGTHQPAKTGGKANCRDKSSSLVSPQKKPEVKIKCKGRGQTHLSRVQRTHSGSVPRGDNLGYHDEKESAELK